MFVESDSSCYLPMLPSTVLAPEAGERAAPECKMQHYHEGHYLQHYELTWAAFDFITDANILKVSTCYS